MATAQGKAAAVGSTQWIQNERDHAAGLVDEEVEEYGYSVRNELDWLNEHMAEIFSQNNVYVVVLCLSSSSPSDLLF